MNRFRVKPERAHVKPDYPRPLLRFILIIGVLVLTRPHAFAAESENRTRLTMDLIDYHAGPFAVDPGSRGSWVHSSLWKPVSEFNWHDLAGQHEFWLKVPLPPDPWEKPALLIKAFLNNLTVYLEEEQIYSSGIDDDLSDHDFKYQMCHVVSLSGYKPGMTVFIRTLYPSRVGLGKIVPLWVGETHAILEALIAEKDSLFLASIRDICFGVLLLLTGVGALFVFMIRRHERAYPFLTFGLFSLSVGATYLSDVDALFFLNLSPETHFYLKTCSFLMVPAGLFAFFGTLFHLRPLPARIVTLMWILHAGLALAAPLFPGIAINDEAVILGVMIINCAVCIGFILTSGHTSPRSIRILFIVFFALFSVLILIHLLERMGVVAATSDMFGWGMLLFVFGLSYVLIQHYARTYQTMQAVSLELAENKSRLLKLEKETLASQFEALKNQINPHFLFNNFSTLASIIEESGVTAVSFVQELSKVYRYVLQTRSSTLVPLKEELDFILSYRFLMSKRFGDNLSITLTVPEAAKDLKVMPFSLQLLVENAIKHNIISIKKPLWIRIDMRNDYLTVTNNLQKKNTPVQSTHIGLDNIRTRYGLMTNRNVRVIETAAEFKVEIPLLGGQGVDDEYPDHRR
jgi:hypothetical protein